MSSSPGPRTEAGQVRGSAPGAARRPSSAPTERIAEGSGPRATAGRVVPCLWLTTETLFVEHGFRHADEVRIAALRLDFAYGASRVRSSDPCRHVFDPARMDEGPIPRDAAAETQARRILESFGALEIESLDDAAVTPGAEVDYVVRLDGDVHALCAFAAYALPQLKRMGWLVEIDPEYPWQVVDTQAPLYAEVTPDDRRPDWFGVELGIEIDGHRVSLLPAVLELLDQSASIEAMSRSPRRCMAVKVDDKRWLPVPPERLVRILRVLMEMYREGDKLQFPAARATSLADLGAALHDEQRPMRWTGDRSIRDQAYALALGPRTDVSPPPPGLNASLRPYQEDGLRWLQHLRSHGAGGVLADDMGLGKTLQTIAHILAEKVSGRMDRPTLVVTLTSLVGNWTREINRFAPQLKVLPLRGPQRRLRFCEIPQHDVVISTYPLLHRDREALTAQDYHLLVLDEAHLIKNHLGQAHEGARALTARHRVALSGTPIENNLGELWSIFEFLNPGMLGDAESFRQTFRYPIENGGDVHRLKVLRDRVRPFILRRTKDTVAKDLPPKTEIVRAVELSGAQRELYESIRVAAHAEVRQQIKTRGIGAATIPILDALLKLRQVCCDPRLVGSEAARGITESAKYDLLLDLIQQQVKQGRRILLFSQFARMLGLVSEGLLGRGIGHVTLTGSTPDRQKPIDAFEAGRADVFLISLKAGGTGLNLTSADTVIHYDPWWNPTAQAQATDRAYRIGQKKPVFVYNLIAAGSVEERMLALQSHKRRLADAILSEGGAGAASLTEHDIDDLLAPLD
jgi:superfamily II DNA or RNA helicase